MTDHNWKTESPKFKMLKMRHDIDNIAFMLKEHCESHPESVTVKGLGDSPLTLDQCDVGMELECIKYPSIPNAIIENISGSYIDTHSFRIPKSGLKSYRIHKPAPAVVHYSDEPRDDRNHTLSICQRILGLTEVSGDWSLVTCADCLKHKPNTLTPEMCVGRKIRCVSHDSKWLKESYNEFRKEFPIGSVRIGKSLDSDGDLNIVDCKKFFIRPPDLIHFELVPEGMPSVPKSPDIDKIKFPTMTLIDLATQYGMKLCTREEWDKLQSDRKEFAEKLEELITILDIASQIP